MSLSYKIVPSTRNMLLLLMCFVCAVSGAVNKTGTANISAKSMSRMSWLKALLDHHEWLELLDNTTRPIPKKCKEDLEQYLVALNGGVIWASKMYDASGQYMPNIMFGSDYWVGSISACKDLQLKKYYTQIPPFATNFYIARINLTMDEDHMPQTRSMLVGECLPTSCGKGAVSTLLQAAEITATRRAADAGFQASFTTIHVRPVPGEYDIWADPKLHILGSAVIIVSVLILVASVYEAFLERKHRIMIAEELDCQNNNKPAVNDAPSSHGNASEDNRDIHREPCGMWLELLLSFSVLSNGRTILSTHRPSDGALTCLHGMRFMSVIWVIMVHTYLTVFYVADNKTMRTVTERNFLYQSVGNASYSVDTFFFISGLLVTVLFLRTEDKKAVKAKEKQQKEIQDVNKNINGFTNSALSVSVLSQNSFSEDLMYRPKKRYSKAEFFGMIKSFFVLFSYRVLRLTPAYAFVIGVEELALRYTHDRSVFEPAIYDHITCDKFWWRNLLYINNLYPQREMCMVWSWYMANDTQFYVVGIILLLISVKHFKVAFVAMSGILVSSWATTIYISVWHHYKARIQEPFEMFDPLYDKPWSRIGPYLVGMAVGVYLHRTRCQVKIPYWLVIVGWPTALAIFGSLIFGMVDGFFEVWPTAFYVSIGHTAWGVGLAWVTIACCCGYGGLVNSALSYRGLLPLSRLTYGAYLIHPTIMMYICFLLDGPFHLENASVLTSYAGFAVMAFLSSFLISLAFEAPAVRLLKIISGSNAYRKRKS